MNPVIRLSRTLLLLALALNLVLPVTVTPCQAQIYRWQDQEGHWHFSDSPTSEVPIEQPPMPSWNGSAAKPAASPHTSDAPPAPSPAEQELRPSAGVPQGGLLWRISGNGITPSYLLGTIHSADPRVVRLKPAVQEALVRSERFVMEMQMDADVLLSLGASMIMTDGNNLESVLGRDLYDQVLKAMTAYGFPEAVVNTLKPWAVMALLSMPKPSGEPVLDMVLYQRAQAAGKPTAGLESAEEQLAVFEGLSMPDQVALLKMTIAQLADLPGFFDRLIQAYAADDLQAVADLAAGYNHQDESQTTGRFMSRLNDDRNRRMVQRMTPYLQQGNSLVAVGALHLTGPAGLLQLLRQRGFEVMPVR